MWIHSYRPLRDHCEQSKLGGARGSHLSPLPPEARSCASRAAPRGSRRGPKPGPAARSCRAQPLLAPPRGPLSAIGGLDSPAAGHRREAHESPVSPPAPTAALLPAGRSRPSPSARAPHPPPAPALPPPHPLAARILHLHVSRILNSNRSSSRFDQFQLPMTSFVCSCHWPPNRFVTCARRSLRSHAT